MGPASPGSSSIRVGSAVMDRHISGVLAQFIMFIVRWGKFIRAIDRNLSNSGRNLVQCPHVGE